MRDPFGWLFSQNWDYFRPYENQVEPGYKGHPIKFMVNFLDRLGSFWTIEDHVRPYWTFWDHFYPLKTFQTFWDHIWPFLPCWIIVDSFGLINGLIEHTFKLNILFFRKIHRNTFGPDKTFSCSSQVTMMFQKIRFFENKKIRVRFSIGDFPAKPVKQKNK